MSHKQAKRLRQAQRKATGASELEIKRAAARGRRDAVTEIEFRAMQAENRRLLARSTREASAFWRLIARVGAVFGVRP